MSLLGISWLWFVGATFLTSFFNFAKDVLSANPDVVTVLLATFSIGIGTGSLMCEKLSKRRVEIGLVPLGSIGISVFAIDLFFASHRIAPASHLLGVGEFLAIASHWRILADLFLLAMFGGFYSVPLYALIQSRSQPTHRARIIAANNILNSFFMIVSAVLALGADVARRRHSGAVPHDGAFEYRRRGVHLFARAGVFAALCRVAAGAHVLPHPPRRRPAHSRARRGGAGVQPRRVSSMRS